MSFKNPAQRKAVMSRLLGNVIYSKKTRKMVRSGRKLKSKPGPSKGSIINPPHLKMNRQDATRTRYFRSGKQ